MSVTNYQNKHLRKLINVYQLNYKNSLSQGFGDYLNGCFCLIQICTKFNITFDIDIQNHPISKYFIKNDSGQDNIDYNNVYFYKLSDDIRSKKSICYNTFINYLNNITDKNHYFFCNFDPFYPVQDNGRNIMKQKFMPTTDIVFNVHNILQNFGLAKQEFEIIHIRTGDKYLLNKTNKMYVNEIDAYKKILFNNTDRKTKYIIISDNMYLKTQLKCFDNFYINDCEICHTGENSNKDEESLKNTIIDFFIMSHSRNIISISLKSRGGTGFSRLCATMFNIPYNSLLIDLGHHLE
jgi:hypothetical protein